MKRTLFTIFFAVAASFAGGQTIDDYTRQINNLQREIEITNELLEQTQKEQNSNRSQLRLVETNIRNRRTIISSLDKQISLVNSDVRSKTNTVNALKKELGELKEEYAGMMASSYRNYKTNNYMSFLFAATDFNDATRRIYYMKRYTAMRERKAEVIDSVSTLLSSEIADLGMKKSNLDSTRVMRTGEVSKLTKEESTYRNIGKTLNTRATQYTRSLKEMQAAIKSAEKEIERIMAEEARKAQGLTGAAQEAYIQLSGEFDQNKGKLPYPIKGGVITSRFGTQPSMTNSRISTINNGIILSTGKGTEVRSVFNGKVMLVYDAEFMNKAVIIEHGKYRTFYINLQDVYVKKGDVVTTNQAIGKTYYGNDPDRYFLMFQIWEIKPGNTAHPAAPLNPEPWLKR